MKSKDLNDWMRGMEGIARKHRKDLDELNFKLAGIQRYLNSSEALAALARGVKRRGAQREDGKPVSREEKSA